jgi:5'(3')-deoxyribonucleotidase
MFILCNKLKHIKKVLRDFSKKYFAKISDRVLVAKRVMEKAQCLMQTNPSDLEIYRAEPILVKKNMRLAKAEESFLRQNSWL